MYDILVKLDSGDEIVALVCENKEAADELLSDIDRVLGNMESHSIKIGSMVALKGRIVFVSMVEREEIQYTLS